MAHRSIAVGDKIIVNFAWNGPNIWNGGSSNDGMDIRVIKLTIQGAKTEIQVNLPQKITAAALKRFPFTCRRYRNDSVTIWGWDIASFEKETNPTKLVLTLEQIHQLTITAGFFTKGKSIGSRLRTLHRTDKEVDFVVPRSLETGGKYTLMLTASEDFSLSARLVKEKGRDLPTEITIDLDSLSIEELEKLLVEASILDKELETRRLRASRGRDHELAKKIQVNENSNMLLMKKLVEAIQKRGVKPLYPPRSARFVQAESQCNFERGKVLENCIMQ